MNKISKGKKGEELAVEYLKKQGLEIVETNWRYSRIGELDIIAIEKGILVFIEVKTRSSLNYGHPLEAVNLSKMNQIINLAQLYLNQCDNFNYKGYRFDVVGIILKKSPEIIYRKDVYQF